MKPCFRALAFRPVFQAQSRDFRNYFISSLFTIYCTIEPNSSTIRLKSMLKAYCTCAAPPL